MIVSLNNEAFGNMYQQYEKGKKEIGRKNGILYELYSIKKLISNATILLPSQGISSR